LCTLLMHPCRWRIPNYTEVQRVTGC
jgi:hypothetical protein